MVKQTNRKAAPAPQEMEAGTPVSPAANDEKLTLDVVAPQGGTRNVFITTAKADATKAATKISMMGTIRQQLAEARDYQDQGGHWMREATTIADKAGLALYQGRTAGLLTGDELSATLGDAFGFKTRPSDGKASKTPDGLGEDIRKRIVRAVAATEYVTGNSVPGFFSGIPEDEVEPVVTALENGEISLWSAYGKFTDIKRAHQVRLDIAFDPKKIAAIVAALSSDGSGERVKASPGLVAAYGALIEVLSVIGDEPVVEDTPE